MVPFGVDEGIKKVRDPNSENWRHPSSVGWIGHSSVCQSDCSSAGVGPFHVWLMWLNLES